MTKHQVEVEDPEAVETSAPVLTHRYFGAISLAKKKKSQLRKLFSLLTSLSMVLGTGAGMGGWVFRDSSLVSSVVAQVRKWVPDGLSPLEARPERQGEPLPSSLASHTLMKSNEGVVGSANQSPPAAGDTISIASFNIQVFGTSKMKKPKVMEVIVKIIRRFDLVAIQELRSKDDALIPKFVQMINADGSQYHYVVGPRLGRSSSKEQYVFVYDTRRIEMESKSVLTISDPTDLLHREPLLTHFRVRSDDPARAFTFWLMNIHTDPDEVPTEVDALADAFASVQQQGWGEDDVIVLGDLNADENHLGKLGQLPGIQTAIQKITTNTRGNRSYDNLVFDQRATTEYLGKSGVLNMMQEFQLSEIEALKVSDHLPIWAEFSAYENANPEQMARQPNSRQAEAGRY
jgi:deoxyribonuclease-1-like protein